MKRWRYKISIRDIKGSYKNILPINFECSIEDIEGLEIEEIEETLIGIASNRVNRVIKEANVVSLEFGKVNEKFSFTYVYVYIE
jgi:hypothetical protein|nr:MAG TPA: hypothetical protein [Caudoviricetes sp.]